MTELQAITCYQPWATLIAYDAKPYEFRGRAAPRVLYGKRVAIHASVRKPNLVEIRALLVKLHSNRWRETGLHRSRAIDLLEALKGDYESMSRGGVVCTAVMGSSIAPMEVCRRLGLEPSEAGNWAWPMSEVVRLEPPVPAKGQQGWWPVKIDVEEYACAHV